MSKHVTENVPKIPKNVNKSDLILGFYLAVANSLYTLHLVITLTLSRILPYYLNNKYFCTYSLSSATGELLGVDVQWFFLRQHLFAFVSRLDIRISTPFKRSTKVNNRLIFINKMSTLLH